MKMWRSGFTLLEIMLALAILAITLTAVLRSQSHSLSLATEARFRTTAPLLAQHRAALAQAAAEGVAVTGSGEFGEEFPGYAWAVVESDPPAGLPEEVARHLKQIVVRVTWGQEDRYRYDVRFYRFLPSPEQ